MYSKKKIRKRKYNTRKKKGGWDETNENYKLYKETNYGKIDDFMSLADEIIKDIRNALKNLLGDNTPIPGYESKTASTITDNELKHIYNYKNLADYIPDKDDGDYSQIKFTKIKAGTIFYRRQRTNKFEQLSWRPTWLNYTSRISNNFSPKKSFLIEKLNENQNNTRITRTKEKFGKYLFKLKTTKDLIVIHFPNTISSFAESAIRTMDSKNEYTFLSTIDGYTLDFLEFNKNPIFKNLPSIKDYRELKLHNTSNLEVVDVINSP